MPKIWHQICQKKVPNKKSCMRLAEYMVSELYKWKPRLNASDIAILPSI